MNNAELTRLLMMLLIIMITLLFGLAIVYLLMKAKKAKEDKQTISTENVAVTQTSAKEGKQSVFKFMEFDKIEDNMIIQKKGKRYLMVVSCQGVNYDLMSTQEKIAVEEGFQEFLNALRNPIQIYVQTRTVNLNSSISSYNEHVKEIENKLNKTKMQYEEMKKSGAYTKEELDKVYYEITKQTNLYEYGKDIVYNTEKMSLNKNVLNKSYYIILPYYPDELDSGNFDKEEIKNMAFSELYTRSLSIIRSLAACGVSGKVMDSTELAELLYMAYNRDEAEVFGIQKAIESGYDELYSTAPDVLDKKMKEINRQIQEGAVIKAKEKLDEVKSEKQKLIEEKEKNMVNLINNMAKVLLEQNKKNIGKEEVEAAIKKIDEEKTKEKGGAKNEKTETKKRGRTRKVEQ